MEFLKDCRYEKIHRSNIIHYNFASHSLCKIEWEGGKAKNCAALLFFTFVAFFLSCAAVMYVSDGRSVAPV